MSIFSRGKPKVQQLPGRSAVAQYDALPQWHPATPLCEWYDGHVHTIEQAKSGCFVVGSSGSGKTSSVIRRLAAAYMRSGMGALCFAMKPDDIFLWESLARACGRESDVRFVDITGKESYNFLSDAASQIGRGSALTPVIVSTFDQMGEIVTGTSGDKAGENSIFVDSVRSLIMSSVDVVRLASKLQLSMQLLYEIAASIPLSRGQAADPDWQADSVCNAVLTAADLATQNGSAGDRQDFELRKHFFLHQFAGLSDRTRTIVMQMFHNLIDPFVTSPFRELFSSGTTITPRDAFEGKWIVVNIPPQEYEKVALVAYVIWKANFQKAVLKRISPNDGSFLRPVALFCDEYQLIANPKTDILFQGIARSSGCCSVYATQSRESLIDVFGDEHKTDSWLGNLSAKFICQCDGTTADWAARLCGERYVHVSSESTSISGDGMGGAGMNRGTSVSEDKRFYIEPHEFFTLKRGGAAHDYLVETILHQGGKVFTHPETGEQVPYMRLTFDQRR